MPGPPRKNNHPLTGYCHNVKALARQQVITANPRAGHARPLQRSKKQKAAYLKRDKRLLAGVEGFEPSARGFGALLYQLSYAPILMMPTMRILHCGHQRWSC